MTLPAGAKFLSKVAHKQPSKAGCLHDAPAYAECSSRWMLDTCRQLVDGLLHAGMHLMAQLLSLMFHMLWQSLVDTLILQTTQANHATLFLVTARGL